METQYTSLAGSNGVEAKPRRRLKPEVAARLVRSAQSDLSGLYAKPVDQLTPLEMQRMKQAFLSGL